MDAVKKWGAAELARILGASDTSGTIELTSYVLSLSTETEKLSYLTDLLGDDPRVTQFAKDLHMRASTSSVPPPANPRKAALTSPSKAAAPDKNTRAAPSHPAPASKAPHYVGLMTEEGQGRVAEHLPGRHVCECMAARHALVNNCTHCGRIVCSQEGSGPCFTCGNLVCTAKEMEIIARDSSKAAKLRDKLAATPLPSDPALSSALAHKNKLLGFDRTAAKRTKVIDDESDYFSADSNRWLSPEERDARKKTEEKRRLMREEAKKKITITLDFAGRRVVTEDHSADVPDLYAELAEPMTQQSLDIVKRQIDDMRLRAGLANAIDPAVATKPKFIHHQQ